MNNIYMLQDHVDHDRTRRLEGKSYAVDANKAQELVAIGAAVRADFPTLDSIERNIERAVEMYKEHADRIDKNTVMSAHERQYSVLKAREALDQKVEQLKKDYATELKALTVVAAQNAFKVEAPTPESQAFVDGVLLQLRTGKAEDVAEMIRAQLPIMPAATKAELVRRFDEIEKYAPATVNSSGSVSGKTSGIFRSLLPALRDNSSALKYKMLTTIQRDGAPDTAYRHLKMIHRTYQPGYLTQDVAAQYRSDREYEAAMAALKAGESI